MIKVLFLILLSCNLNGAEHILIDPSIDPLSDEMVNAINSLNTTWKAKRNFVGFSYDYVLGLAGAIPGDPLPKADIIIANDIPSEFDARKIWPNCSSISHIGDQGSCGSCWAMAAVGAMSDRICIKSGGQIQVELSAEDVLACARGNGCDRGSASEAWRHWQKGIVTGGGYNGTGCKPYQYPPCNHNSTFTLPNCTEIVEKPDCIKKCKPGYPKTYEEDKYFGFESRLLPSDTIQTQIMKYGPVEATFEMKSDFFVYGSGVYQPHGSSTSRWHSVRILGWGVERGVKYWLTANSWGTDWGDKGFIKIIRGDKKCKIENAVHAGIPKLKI